MIVICIQGISLHAQNTKTTAGIYLTEQDYKTGKLSYVLNENSKLRLNDFLGGKNIGLVYQGKKMKLSKSEVFGYRQDNQDFRLFHNEAYRILDTAGFLLYKRQQLVQQGKGYVSVERYFYSTDPAKPVLSLTMENIDKSFSAQSEFRYSIQSYFHQDADLIAFDKADNQYAIKHLYFEHNHITGAQHAAL